MASPTSHRLLARLQRDLAELRDQPYPGVDVFIDDADIRKFCLVLTPPAGPWTDFALHFDVALPNSWPSEPPQITSSVHGIDHPNLFDSFICCDLLKPMDYLQRGYTGGYTPALTLRGLFLQFLTFFSSTSVEQDYGGASVTIGDSVLATYISEKDMANVQFQPWDNCCSLRVTDGFQDSQDALASQWRADRRPETAVISYKSHENQLTHKVKGNTPNPNRIHKFERPNPRRTSTYELISKWTCRKCPYGSADLPHQAPDRNITMEDALDPPVNALYQTPPTGVLHLLNDDVLLEIASHLQSEALITFGRAYRHFYHLISDQHVFLLRELQCFFLKTPLHQGILGIGVAYEPGSRTLSSDFDWLSLEAFTNHNVRKSIEKRDFEYFIPLAFNRGHFDRARIEIWSRIAKLDMAVQQAEIKRQQQGGRGGARGRGGQSAGGRNVPAQRPHIFNILYKMMNNIVVSLMKSCDDALASANRPSTSSTQPTLLNASEKAVISYCHLIHLLCCVCRVQHSVLEDARERMRSFLQSPSNRTKAQTPDLGELIVIITLVLIMTPPNQVNGPSWGVISGPFLEEAIIRNVRWVLKDSPELEVIEQGPNDYRLAQTFRKSKTSLRLIMFQITFLDLFIKTYHTIGIRALDQNYGFPESHLPEKMVEEIKEIYKVETWPGFFAKVQYKKVFSKSTFSDMLRAAVKTSGERKYHYPSRLAEMERLRPLRRELERAWTEAQTRR